MSWAWSWTPSARAWIAPSRRGRRPRRHWKRWRTEARHDGAAELREAVYGAVLGWAATESLELLSECNAHGNRPFHSAELVCGLGARRDITEHVGLMGAFEPVIAGSDPERAKYHMYLGVQTHIRGGGFWKGARRALIGK